MTTLFVTEFSGAAIVKGQPLPAYDEAKMGAQQSVSIGASSAATTNAVASNTNLLRLLARSDCHVAFGASPTASTSTLPLTANVEFPIAIPQNANYKVAVIEA